MSSLKYESENITEVKLSRIQNKSRFANAHICRPFTNHLANPVRIKETHNKKILTITYESTKSFMILRTA